MVGLRYAQKIGFQWLINIQIFYIRSGDHEGTNLSFIQAENVANHIMFVLLNDPGFGTFFQHCMNFLFRDARLHLLALSHHSQESISRYRQQSYERMRN